MLLILFLPLTRTVLLAVVVFCAAACRAKFTDFLFIVAGIAVVANLVSILAFKIRLF
jgi:hypothetical protein